MRHIFCESGEIISQKAFSKAVRVVRKYRIQPNAPGDTNYFEPNGILQACRIVINLMEFDNGCKVWQPTIW